MTKTYPIGSLLRLPAFRSLALGSTLSRAGSGIAPIALAFAVLDADRSLGALGVVVGSRSIANVALLLFGGVLADRFRPRVLLVGSSILSGMTQAAVAVLVIAHVDPILALASLAALGGATSAISLPLTTSLTRRTLPDDLLQPGTAVMRLGANSAGLIGTALGGVLVAAFGPGTGIAIDAGTYLLAAAFFVGVRVQPAVRRQASTFIADLTAGWTAFRTRTWLWTVVLAFTAANCCYAGAIDVLGPAVADASFGRAVWGLVLAAQTAGYVVGGILAIRIRFPRPLVAAMIAAAPFAAVPAAIALIPAPLALGGFLLLSGIGAEIFEVQWAITMQREVPTDLLARVSSYDLLGSFLAIPLGQLIAAPAATAVGVAPALLTGGLIGTAALLTCLLVPGLRALRRPAIT